MELLISLHKYYLKNLKFMKKIILLLFCLLFNLSVHSTGWEALLEAISFVESRHNPKARNGIYVGCLQIGPLMVKECNSILKNKIILKGLL